MGALAGGPAGAAEGGGRGAAIAARAVAAARRDQRGRGVAALLGHTGRSGLAPEELCERFITRFGVWVLNFLSPQRDGGAVPGMGVVVFSAGWLNPSGLGLWIKSILLSSRRVQGWPITIMWTSATSCSSKAKGAAARWREAHAAPGDGRRFRCRQVALARFMLQDLLTIRADRDRFVSYMLIFI